MESLQKPQAWSPVVRRSCHSRKRAHYALAAAGCVWLRPWSPVSFSIAETQRGAMRRHPPNDMVCRGKARDVLCGDRRPGRWVGAGFVALSVFGFFEGHDGDAHGDVKDSRRQSRASSNRGRRRSDDPDDALKRLLLEEDPEHEHDSMKRTISDWWDYLPLVGQSESRKKRRAQREEVPPEDGEEDSIRRTVSEWWDNLPFVGQSNESRRKRRTQKEEERPSPAQDVEDAESGMFNILASVKTSVAAAVMGTGRVEEKVEGQDAEKEPKGSFAQFLPEFPSSGLFGPQEDADLDISEAKEEFNEKEEESEDWWQNAQAALGMAEPKEATKEAKQMDEESDQETVVATADTEVLEAEEKTEAEETGKELEEEEEEAAQGEADEAYEADKTEEADVVEDQEEDRLPPEVPGMEDANLIVRVDIDPKRQSVSRGAKAIENLMSRSDREVLEAMAQEGWEVEVVDESEGLYMLSLPPVLYEVMGTSVSIPAPRFLTKLRDCRGRISKFKERLEGDLVLQNGEGIFTLQLGFPFRTKLCISAAGWTRATVGSEGNEILSSNYVEVGIQLPKVPGLTNIMEYFVKNYGTQSTQECTDALARAADRLPETPLQSIEDTMKEFLKPLTDPDREGTEKNLVESGPGRPSS